ncbi:MAG: aldolase [Methanotrichaceae archaeon]
MPLEQWTEIVRFGKRIVQAGLTSSRFGNISLLRGNDIIITRTGSLLDELDGDQIIDVDLSGPCPKDKIASTEVCVHRAIYNKTSAKAVIHTHSPYAVALSLIEDEIEPIDSEGKHFLGPMPVVDGSFGTDILAENVSSALMDHSACIARGHGAFAAGKSLTEAYTIACMAEHSSQVRYLVMVYKND